MKVFPSPQHSSLAFCVWVRNQIFESSNLEYKSIFLFPSRQTVKSRWLISTEGADFLARIFWRRMWKVQTATEGKKPSNDLTHVKPSVISHFPKQRGVHKTHSPKPEGGAHLKIATKAAWAPWARRGTALPRLSPSSRHSCQRFASWSNKRSERSRRLVVEFAFGWHQGIDTSPFSRHVVLCTRGSKAYKGVLKGAKSIKIHNDEDYELTNSRQAFECFCTLNGKAKSKMFFQ